MRLARRTASRRRYAEQFFDFGGIQRTPTRRRIPQEFFDQIPASGTVSQSFYQRE
jgi:hypothetical protein